VGLKPRAFARTAYSVVKELGRPRQEGVLQFHFLSKLETDSTEPSRNDLAGLLVHGLTKVQVANFLSLFLFRSSLPGGWVA